MTLPKKSCALCAVVALFVGCSAPAPAPKTDRSSGVPAGLSDAKPSPDISRVKMGMSRGEVIAIAGYPTTRGPFKIDAPTEIWAWGGVKSGKGMQIVAFRKDVVIFVQADPAASSQQTLADLHEVVKAHQAGDAEEEAKAERERMRTLGEVMREKYVAERPNLSPSIKQAIIGRKITVGMSEADVRASWGDPDRVNRSAGIHGTTAQMIYGQIPGPVQYVYLQDDKVTSWQSTGGR